MRCPDCQKFVGLETEVEVNSEDISADEHGVCITINATVNRNCAECGQTLKSLDYDIEETISGEELKAGEEAKDWAEREDTGAVELECGDADVSESGGGRYTKNLITVSVPVTITIGDELLYEGEVEDTHAASEFEEQV